MFVIVKTSVAETTQQIELNAGWNLISANVLPSDDYRVNGVVSVQAVLASIEDRIIIAKDELGRFEIPARNYFGLGEWNSNKAYFIRMREAARLEITGDQIAIETPVRLHLGWNLAPYIPTYRARLSYVFQELIESGRAIMIKDGAGRFYRPGDRFNIVGASPGMGFMICVSGGVEFRYPAEAP